MKEKWTIIFRMPSILSFDEKQIRLTLPKEFKKFIDHWEGKELFLVLMKREGKRRVMIEED
jgi:hypothetical protein